VYRNESRKAMIAYLNVWIPRGAADRKFRYTISIKTTTPARR
jgi:hypothetical protein